MFALKRRPRGLEVPACSSCNKATGPHEQVAAMLGRLYPDGPTQAEREEMGRIMDAVNRNIPGLLQEMMPSTRQQARFDSTRIDMPGARGPLNCSGPLLNRSIQTFGAKLGFALHYAETGHIIPPTGGVAVRWFSNFDAVTGDIPPGVFEILGPDRTLEQGKWSVGDQFNYATAVAADANMAVYFSMFRMSFAVLSWVNEDRSEFKDVAKIQVFLPGGFQIPLGGTKATRG